MRLHAEHWLSDFVNVFVDEIQQDRCIWADEETGEAFIYIKDENRFVKYNGKFFDSEILKGKVEIRPKQELLNKLIEIRQEWKNK